VGNRKKFNAWTLFNRAMRSLKLFNWKNEVALTNVALYIVLYKVAVTDMGEMSIGEVATAMSVMGLYFGKKFLNKDRPIEKIEDEGDTP
jgi:hypothetical protein